MFQRKETKPAKKELIDRQLSVPQESPAIQLFPLDSQYVAAIISTTTTDSFPFHQGEMTYAIQSYDNTEGVSLAYSKRSFSNKATDYKPYVMPDGYFLRPASNKNDDNKTFLHRMQNDIDVTIKEDLYPSIVANISKFNNLLDFACVSTSRDKLYLYHFLKQEIIRITSIGVHYQKNYEPVSWNQAKTEIIFANSEKINALAACNHEDKIYLAIAFDDGTLRLSNIVNDELSNTIYLDRNAEKNFDKIQLFFANNHLLLAYETESSRLRIWDIKKKCQLTEFKCPSLFNCNVAATGDYFSGLVRSEDGKSDRLFLLDLHSCKQQIVKLDSPAEHFVLGYKNYMCSAYQTARQLYWSCQQTPATRANSGKRQTIYIRFLFWIYSSISRRE